MTSSRVLLLLATVLVFSTATIRVAGADTQGFIDMQDRRERMLEVFARGDASEHVRVELVLQTPSLAPDTVRVALVTPDGRFPLSVDASGTVLFGGHRDELARLQGFDVSPFEEDMGFGARLVPRLPLQRELAAADLRASVEAINAVIREEAGLMRFLAPKIEGVQVRLASPEGFATVTSGAGGQRRIEGDGSGVLRIPVADLAGPVRLSDEPLRFDFYD